MKKRMLTLIALLLLTSVAQAEVDLQALEQTPGYTVFADVDGANTVVRPPNQPFLGTMSGDGSLIAYLDLVELPNHNAVAPRLTIALELSDRLNADTVTLRFGGSAYCFAATPVISDYDMTYYEDYGLYLVGAAQPLMQALVHANGDLIDVLLTAEDGAALEGSVALSADEVTAILARYEEVGGTAQDLNGMEAITPVEVR